MVVLSELVNEMKTLRKGRGLYVSHISERIGAALRKVCDVADTDGPAEIRQKVARRLADLAESLPTDLRLAVMAAFAIAPDARLPLYQDRVSWAAAKLDRDPRTARRRIDDGIHQMAQLATVATARHAPLPVGSSPTGWHTTELRVTVALDRPRPEMLEHRRIVSDRDGLAELDLSMTLNVLRENGNPGPRELGVGVFYGGTLLERGMESCDRFAFGLALPAPLARGAEHSFALHVRVPDGQAMRPYYACVPRYPCELFDLRVRFDRDRPPPRIWLLRHMFQRDLDDPEPRGEALAVDRAGEIHVTFCDLNPGMAYGVRWDPVSTVEERGLAAVTSHRDIAVCRPLDGRTA